MKDVFSIAAGTIPGRDHVGTGNLLIGRNNQDGYAVLQTPLLTAAAVCDGCGSSPHSEVGAKLGARLVVAALDQALGAAWAAGGSLDTRAEAEALWEHARQDVLAQLRVLARALGPSLSDTVRDDFLFTVVAALVSPATTSIAVIGDGYVFKDGAEEVLQCGDAPPYLGYALLDDGATPFADADLRFRLWRFEATHPDSVMILGTDGVAHLLARAGETLPGTTEALGTPRQFAEDNAYWKNPDALRRRLARMNSEVVTLDRRGQLRREPGRLPDDTTLVIIRGPGRAGH